MIKNKFFLRFIYSSLLAIFAWLLYYGWNLFWFITDDAYIVFRYIHNSIEGHGYVWNPQPFRAVEGYTCFLWMILLEITWRCFDILPPDAANVYSLFFSGLTLALGALLLWRLELGTRYSNLKIVWIVLMLLGTISNRTFLAWTSSGLETAMFNFFVTLWIFCGVTKPKHWQFKITLCVSLIYLTRPDGLLFAISTLALIGNNCFRDKNFKSFRQIWPLAAIPLHLLWRKWHYGEWLPNTYYAKNLGSWIEAGTYYLFSFIMEYSLWFWGILAFCFFIKLFLLWRQKSLVLSYTILLHNSNIIIATIFAHIGYYTFAIGGDHFEYRIYSYLILLVFISWVWLLHACNIKTTLAITLTLAFIILSWPIPWSHWKLTHQLNTRKQTYDLKQAISPSFPKFARPYTQIFDNLQKWLISRGICIRHQEHKIFTLFQKQRYPSRETGINFPAAKYPVLVTSLVGIAGWHLPNVCIIDSLGLNDYVIARHTKTMNKIMAHGKIPPKNYIESFAPNVVIRKGKIFILKRIKPLSERQIIAIENYWWSKAKKGELSKR